MSDNFARATDAIKPTSPRAQKIKDHYDMIEKSIQDVFDKLGMKTIPTVGEPFNYEVHQAVMSRYDDDSSSVKKKTFYYFKLSNWYTQQLNLHFLLLFSCADVKAI